MTPELEALGRRIERLSLDPDAIDAPLVRLVRPILAQLGWRPSVSVVATQALVAALGTADEEQQRALLARAQDELDANVTSVERAIVVNKAPLVSHAAWLRRLWEVVARAARAAEEPDPSMQLLVGTSDPIRLLPPLALREVSPGTPADDAGGTDTEGRARADTGRLLDLQLGAVDHLIDAALGEVDVLGRKQRLLEAARQVLLETAAALPLDPSGVAARQAFLGREITRIDRLRAEGLAPEVRAVHQAREAFDRGERDRLHAALLAVGELARGAGDARLAGLARRGVQQLWASTPGLLDPNDPIARRASLDVSAERTFGRDFVQAVASACDSERDRRKKARKHGTGWTVELSLPSDASRSLMDAALAAGGRFEVGGPLLPVRVVTEERFVRAVRFPTPELVLLPATDPGDVPDAVIEDPRMLLLSLAAGRLLARRYVLEETHKQTRTVLRAEVRAYVLDGSTSMTGPRARMRDAILLAELATLKRRAETGAGEVALYYRYFNDEVGPARKVDTAHAAMDAIEDVVTTVREGDTNIQKALLASLDDVRAARAKNADLAHAQIVVVTDGEAPVAEQVLAAAREPIGDLPIGLSVIALGAENPALRGIVARQRAKGERAFYHFVDDDALEGLIERGEIDDGPALHLPPLPRSVAEGGSTDPPELASELGALLDEMGALGRARDLEALEALDVGREADIEAGVSAPMHTEGERAKARALYKDRRTLEEGYLRWFPLPVSGPSTAGSADVDAALVVLATVAEVAGVVGGGPLARQADAIELLERLLPDAQLSPARYRAVLAEHAPALADALRAVHLATGRMRP